MSQLRIGIDVGGTKIEAVLLSGEGEVLARKRVPTPQGDYLATIAAVKELVQDIECDVGRRDISVGIGHPGAISPATGLIKNANSTCLNAQPLKRQLEEALGREVRMANDANCLALSEAADGAAKDARSIFAVILGTGVGGGIFANGALLAGANGIAGEWGHNSLPWPRVEWAEWPGKTCWCGQSSCLETWLSGVALATDHQRVTGNADTAEGIAAKGEAGDELANATLARYEDRLARALAQIINLLDPEVIVLGGGVSRVKRLYRHVPALWDQWIFSDSVATKLLPARHGDSSGVLGAARLWPLVPGR